MTHSRRTFLTGTAAAAVATALPAPPRAPWMPVKRAGPSRLRIGLAAYSMRQYLQAKPGTKGAMDLLGFVDWAATLDTDAVELTSYFFPEQVTKTYLNDLKRRCHVNGLDISGGAIRNNFTLPPGPELEKWFSHLDMWLDHYAQLGAPVIRVFAGVPPKDVTEEQGIQNAIGNLRRACEMAATPRRDPRAREPRLPDQHRSHAADREGGRLALVRREPRLGQRRPAPTSTPSWRRSCPTRSTSSSRSRPDRRPRWSPTSRRVVGILRQAGYRGYIVLEYESKPEPYEAIPKHLAELRAALDGKKA